MRVAAKEHEPDVSHDMKENEERKETNEDKWVKPRNCMSIKCFFKLYENAEEWRKNNNAFIASVDKDEIEEEEENETKGVKNNKTKLKTIEKEKGASKVKEDWKAMVLIMKRNQRKVRNYN